MYGCVSVTPEQRNDCAEVALPAWAKGSGLSCHGDEGDMQMVVVLIVLPCDRALMLSCVPGSLALSAQRVLCVCLNTRPIFSVKTPTSALKSAVI